jgi:hypothetical protein
MKINKEYGKYLNTIKWNYSGVIRRHFPLNELNSNKMLNKLIRHKTIDRVFFAIEPDTNDPNMTHGHILVKTHGKYDYERLAKELGINKGAVNLEEVQSNKGISHYVSKYIGKDYSFYNIY